MKKILILFLILAIGFALSACADDATAPAAQTTAQQSENQQTITTELTVWGMTCRRCESQIASVLSSLEGVVDISVDFRDDKVIVEHDSALDVDTIKSVIEAEGYNIP